MGMTTTACKYKTSYFMLIMSSTGLLIKLHTVFDWGSYIFGYTTRFNLFIYDLPQDREKSH